MADEPYCPHCRSVRLCHTGALWMCPRCSLMITKHALAADTAGTGGESRPSENGVRADNQAGYATD